MGRRLSACIGFFVLGLVGASCVPSVGSAGVSVGESPSEILVHLRLCRPSTVSIVVNGVERAVAGPSSRQVPVFVPDADRDEPLKLTVTSTSSELEVARVVGPFRLKNLSRDRIFVQEGMSLSAAQFQNLEKCEEGLPDTAAEQYAKLLGWTLVMFLGGTAAFGFVGWLLRRISEDLVRERQLY